MGTDLTLLPLDADYADLKFSHTVLSVERRRELWPQFDELPKTPIGGRFTCYVARRPDDERGYGELREDAYGQPIQCSTAAQILTLRKHWAVQDNAQNRAIWAYLAELPPETRVALHWH